ncbi:hypothetical protein [Anaeromicropila herbilytica]|uniref:Uncharacterized protein n=1 Tax=Anaeromicropila herbilytica TaxID=2785025 RepID=A0A7R7EL17_9FIRM|nr:hypothetical protein [Anaeromicropila herbilytica]BCN30744.1 hypothetical protein bsdtb5_20390 [Anaeromicropila herbilytica]
MNIRCIWEYNGTDTILYSENYIGAFTRGATLDIALDKMAKEIESYLLWKKEDIPELLIPEIVQKKESNLQICDADSDIIFDTEKIALSQDEYYQLKELVLKSATDFHALYEKVPNKDKSYIPKRKTFYGNIPRTAREMYEHTRSVNSYYFGEIGVQVDHDGTIYECRQRGFDLLEQSPDFLTNPIYHGSYDEDWTLRKVIRRFIWHDRIHAKAMYRMANKTFGMYSVDNVFGVND